MKLIILVVCLAAVFADPICDVKTAIQSTTSTYGRNGYAYRAVDDEKNPDSDEGEGCTHTDTGDPNPWLLVDLGCDQEVHKVIITNRIDNSQRLHGFVVTVSSELPNPDIIDDVCVQQEDALPSGEHTLHCDSPMFGRYVMLRFSDPSAHDDSGSNGRYIHVCDVSVG